jgi:von Willebrand factor A domain-containing protein 8
MMKKDNLGQDLFLIGRPGKLKRNLAMTYLQLTNQEAEYISLSRDTSESDLKQRREIHKGTAFYIDQAAVKAAREGRILIIDGVEKAERNILPILNNLLENREMHLEDGTFLVSSERYEKLLQNHTHEELEKMKLLQVSKDFRVIAIGLPIPKYRGSPLDPPLRSRFQARDIPSLSFGEIIAQTVDVAPNVPEDSIKQIVSFGFAIDSSDTVNALPDFPIDNIVTVGKILENNPSNSIYDMIKLLYPSEIILNQTQKSSVETLMKSLKISKTNNESKTIKSIVRNLNEATVTFERNGWLKGEEISIKIPTCDTSFSKIKSNKFIEIDSQTTLLIEMLQTYAVSDFCLIGGRGTGKSALILELCRMIDQPLEQIPLYKDMSARELLQSRITKPNGDTYWMDSSLVKSAKNGWTVVLDGLHRLHLSVFSILQRLIHDRELQLFDGSRMIRSDKFDELLALGRTEEELNNKGVYRIHPAFRIVALAEPPKLDTTNWLTAEVLGSFLFHTVDNLNRSDEMKIIRSMHGKIHDDMMKIIDLAHNLRERSVKDPIFLNFAQALSTRQLLRIANRLSKFASDEKVDVYEIIQKVFLTKFLPALPRQIIDGVLREFEIAPLRKEMSEIQVKVDKEKNLLKIGKTEVSIFSKELENSLKVPDTIFYETQHYVRLLEKILQDFQLGYHTCLIGNQGVGKNKLIDRLLHLMNYPREYIQLHRDTTVTSLTIAPNIIDGKVIFEDSPLVKAAKHGYALVIDEIDKAPINVTCILKSLVENGEMWLSDGRKIVPNDSEVDVNDKKFIKSHPDFRIIVLANRPGFPFLGNDFFASMGHLFSCHAIDNPDIQSEIELLKNYGPNVDEKLIKKLAKAFAEIRTMADTSQISYPYSTREVVNIVKHLEKYPNEDVSEVVGNVLDFDRHSPESLELVTSVLMKHGLQIAAYAKNELAELRRQKQIQLSVSHFSGKDVSGPKHGKVDEKNEPHVGGNTWAGGTGGRDTAGLGGKGGPYRLDAGHKVHQLSDEEKNSIPEEVKEAARAMNRKAFEEKLKEIKMSSYDHNIYDQFSSPVKFHVKTLRNILNSLEAKTKERHWTKHQTSGELDDMKLVEGITGEKNIYKMRSDQDPEAGAPQEKPKRLTVVVDVSGSMYRFNGYDGRLDRTLEAVTMLMESFEGFENKIQMNIVGHSGESPCIPFVDHKSPPNNDKLRLETLKMMHAHSQYCWQGDNTLNASKIAVENIATEDCDEAIVVILSDANLQRYAIPPKKLTQMLMMKEPKVHAYM